MAKQKKITVRFYLNKDVKPHHPESGADNMYPIYCRVTYDRKNTKFKWGNALIAESAEDDIMHSAFGKKSLQNDELLITRIVRFEEENLGDKFALPGLGDRIPPYRRIIHFEFEGILSKNLDFFVGQFLVHNEYQEWIKMTLDEKLDGLTAVLGDTQVEKLSNPLVTQIIIYKLLHSYHSLISVFDWIVDDARTKFRSHLIQIMDKSNTGKKAEVFGKFLIGESEDVESFTADALKAVDQLVIQVLSDNYLKNMKFKEVKVMPAQRKIQAR